MVGDDIGNQPKRRRDNLWDWALMRDNILPGDKIDEYKGYPKRQPEQEIIGLCDCRRILTKSDQYPTAFGNGQHK